MSRTCDRCRLQNRAGATFCAYCGRSLDLRRGRREKFTETGGVLLLLAIGVWSGNVLLNSVRPERGLARHGQRAGLVYDLPVDYAMSELTVNDVAPREPTDRIPRRLR